MSAAAIFQQLNAHGRRNTQEVAKPKIIIIRFTPFFGEVTIGRLTDYEEDRLTDTNGQVLFPRRTYRSNFATRFVSCMRQIVGLGVHASCGPKSYLVAFGKGVDTIDWGDLS